MIKTIEHSENGVRLCLTGTINSKELLDAHTQITDDPTFIKRKYHLWVFDPVDDFLLSTSDMQKMALIDSALSKVKKNLKIAIVSPSPLVFGLGRMYEAFCDEISWEIMLFYKLEEAIKWVNS